MKNADGLKASWTTLCHAMKTDARFTPDEQAALTAIDVVLDAAGVTTQQQDMVLVQCLKKFCTQMPGNYT
jgi:hypothetical protein